METGFVRLLPGHLRLEPQARTWCLLPYPGHPHGCPNYGHKGACPPKAPQAEAWIKGASSLWLAYVVFDMRSHTQRMHQLHPAWSERQLRCCLYWQGDVNRQLRDYTERLAADTQMWLTTAPRKITYCPEAMGIDVITTGQNAGLCITRNPVSTVYKVALVAQMEA